MSAEVIPFPPLKAARESPRSRTPGRIVVFTQVTPDGWHVLHVGRTSTPEEQ
jgi:hypothetical protein